jgi:voltage-gated potassium channel
MSEQDDRGAAEEPGSPATIADDRGSFMPLVHSFVRAFRDGLEDPAFRALGAILLTLLVSGTIAFHFVEGWGWLDSLYFCVITMATVGYGDFHPITPLGKILAMIFIVLGLGVLVGFAQQLLSHMLADIEEHPMRRRRPIRARRGAEDDRPPDAS